VTQEYEGHEWTILDHGFVRLVGSYGSDEAIDRAARQSYGKGTRRTNGMRGLIRRLMRDRHDSPFEAVDLTFQFRVPIFVARQILRHRLFSVNEISGRYSEILDMFYIPALEQICYQSKQNKQGRAEPLPYAVGYEVRQLIESASAAAFVVYKAMLEQDVARETARMVLPLNTYTTFTLKGNLRTWLHFLNLRMEEHAQWETRQFANAVASHIEDVAPEAYYAWEEYVFHSFTLSRTMKRVVAKYLNPALVKADPDFLTLVSSEQEHFLDYLDSCGYMAS
jgi:thymidylate synthase (FAD)